ncbi:hypothetical protein [Caviibacterium pharyngocola]|uniref:Zinc finger Ogr/Delta-type domain-containing protein n=1 Tax=Caviibacterium pharyngocola TaxID=28159 RepID=A0A2M8RTD6_9PAST|nr:hypothetical protein [Caviibacterium pharyngocola]PJG82148.1 hypothetical protein CVP04_10860 [Caviibacterium pharyngocola]
MASINIKCLNCGSSNLNIRTSKAVTQQTVESECVCLTCLSKQKVLSEIVNLRTPVFTEQPEALKANKPFKHIDPNQLEIFEA